MRKALVDQLVAELGICPPAQKWLRQSKCRTFKEAYESCSNPSFIDYAADAMSTGWDDPITRALEKADRELSIGGALLSDGEEADIYRKHVPFSMLAKTAVGQRLLKFEKGLK